MKSNSDVHSGRFLPLVGTMNARDLGGLPLADGGTTRSGVFFRSDVPLALESADLEELERLGLTTVIDLRQPEELQRDPSSLVGRDGVEWHNVQVWSRIDRQDGPEDEYDISALYLAALDHAGAAFAQAVDILAASKGAALFHCTAGKDRTGLLALLLLEVAGVPTASIIDDFALTHERIGPLRERLLADAEKRGVAREQFARLLGATPELILPAIAHLHARYGGAEAYLRRAGVSEQALSQIKSRLTGA